MDANTKHRHLGGPVVIDEAKNKTDGRHLEGIEAAPVRGGFAR